MKKASNSELVNTKLLKAFNCTSANANLCFRSNLSKQDYFINRPVKLLLSFSYFLFIYYYYYYDANKRLISCNEKDHRKWFCRCLIDYLREYVEASVVMQHRHECWDCWPASSIENVEQARGRPRGVVIGDVDGSSGTIAGRIPVAWC